MPRGIRFSEEVKREAVRRVEEGEGIVTVAHSVPTTVQTLTRWIAEYDAQEIERLRQGEEPAQVPEEEAALERNFALAILDELEVSLSPEMLRVLLNAARKVLGQGV